LIHADAFGEQHADVRLAASLTRTAVDLPGDSKNYADGSNNVELIALPSDFISQYFVVDKIIGRPVNLC